MLGMIDGVLCHVYVEVLSYLLKCNGVDNMHHDTLARPLTFAPIHLISEPGCWSHSHMTVSHGLQGVKKSVACCSGFEVCLFLLIFQNILRCAQGRCKCTNIFKQQALWRNERACIRVVRWTFESQCMSNICRLVLHIPSSS